MDILHLTHVNRQYLEAELVAVGGIAIHHIGDGLDDPHARVKALYNEVSIDLDAVVAQVCRVGLGALGNLDHGVKRVGLLAGEEATGVLVLGDFQVQRRGLAHEQRGTVEFGLERDITTPGTHGGGHKHHGGHHDMSHVL